MPTQNELWKERFKLEKWIREYLWSLDYEETRTPLLVQSPGMEPHIRPIGVIRNATQMQKVGPTFLHTSPEFAMKKLLAMGMERIFQICPSFRDEPHSPEHHPEFSMLEFYETNASLELLKSRVEGLFQHLAMKRYQKMSVPFRGKDVNLESPWTRYKIADLFETHLGIDLRKHQTSELLAQVCLTNKLAADPSESWDDLYFKLWLNFIEPKLPKDRPVFVTHYPVSQSSLCNQSKDETGFTWANRFEVYVGAFELGNAFDELRDAETQRKNFMHDQKVRSETYGNSFPESPIDEALLTAIAKIPPTSGIALGLDRICMLFLNASLIDEILPLKSYW